MAGLTGRLLRSGTSTGGALDVTLSPAALVLFSGGQDSTVCLGWALERYERVETIGFDYGQRHRVELAARDEVRSRIPSLKPDWGARLGMDHLIALPELGRISDTALTRDAVIEMTAAGLPSTFVPGRNLLFLTYAAALAYRRAIPALVAGMCETDYSGYPDCRNDTLQTLARALSLGMDRPVIIETPLMYVTRPRPGRWRRTWGAMPLCASSSSTPTRVISATAQCAMIGVMAAAPARRATCAPPAGSAGEASKPPCNRLTARTSCGPSCMGSLRRGTPHGRS